jgi:hypothetical protein
VPRASVCASICCMSSLRVVLVCVVCIVRELGLHNLYLIRALKKVHNFIWSFKENDISLNLLYLYKDRIIIPILYILQFLSSSRMSSCPIFSPPLLFPNDIGPSGSPRYHDGRLPLTLLLVVPPAEAAEPPPPTRHACLLLFALKTDLAPSPPFHPMPLPLPQPSPSNAATALTPSIRLPASRLAGL